MLVSAGKQKVDTVMSGRKGGMFAEQARFFWVVLWTKSTWFRKLPGLVLGVPVKRYGLLVRMFWVHNV